MIHKLVKQSHGCGVWDPRLLWTRPTEWQEKSTYSWEPQTGTDDPFPNCGFTLFKETRTGSKLTLESSQDNNDKYKYGLLTCDVLSKCGYHPGYTYWDGQPISVKRVYSLLGLGRSLEAGGEEGPYFASISLDYKAHGPVLGDGTVFVRDNFIINGDVTIEAGDKVKADKLFDILCSHADACVNSKYNTCSYYDVLVDFIYRMVLSGTYSNEYAKSKTFVAYQVTKEEYSHEVLSAVGTVGERLKWVAPWRNYMDPEQNNNR